MQRFVKNQHVIYFEIPDYPELAVKHVWPLVKGNQDLIKYFPDYKPSQLPEKEFIYAVLSTLKPNAVRELIASCIVKRAPTSQDGKAGLIEMTSELKESIMNLYSMKSKKMLYIDFIFCFATKGRTSYLLNKGSILSAPRKNPKKYNVDQSQIMNFRSIENQNEEENRGEDVMQ